MNKTSKILFVMLSVIMLNTGCDEFDEGECDKDGYNRYGYDREGYDRDGCNKEGYGRDGYNRSGYNKEGYDRDGYNFFGHDKDGYDLFGYDKSGRNRFGYDRSGYNRSGYNRYGYNRYGYNKEGYDKEGYNRYGYNKEGYDKEGYNRYGYNKEGYNRYGYDKHGRHRSDKDEQKQGGGYKPNGKNRHKKEDDRYDGDHRESEVERRDKQYKADCEAACKVKRLSKLTPLLPKVLKNCTLATRTVDNVEKLLGDIKKHQLDATGLWRVPSEQFNKGAKKVLSEHLDILKSIISVIERSVISSSANSEGKSQAEISESISDLREILAGRGPHFRKVIRNVDQGKYEGHDTEIKKTIRIVLTSIPKYKTIVEALYGAQCEEVCKVQLLSKLESLFPKVLKDCTLNLASVSSVKKLIADTKKHHSNATNLRVASSEDFNEKAKEVLSKHLEILKEIISVIEGSVIRSSLNRKGKSQAKISTNILRKILAGRETHFNKVIKKVDSGKYKGRDIEIRKLIEIVLASIPKYQAILRALLEELEKA